jgi:hypothetical protein
LCLVEAFFELPQAVMNRKHERYLDCMEPRDGLGYDGITLTLGLFHLLNEPCFQWRSVNQDRVAFCAELSRKCEQRGLGRINWWPIATNSEIDEHVYPGELRLWYCAAENCHAVGSDEFFRPRRVHYIYTIVSSSDLSTPPFRSPTSSAFAELVVYPLMTSRYSDLTFDTLVRTTGIGEVWRVNLLQSRAAALRMCDSYAHVPMHFVLKRHGATEVPLNKIEALGTTFCFVYSLKCANVSGFLPCRARCCLGI